MASVDLNALVRDAIRLAELDHEAQVALRASFFEPLPRIKASPEPLARAIYHLLVNARKSLEGMEGGVIELETEPDGDLVAVRILDNGPGMSEDQLEQIFDPFAAEAELGGESEPRMRMMCPGSLKPLRSSATTAARSRFAPAQARAPVSLR